MRHTLRSLLCATMLAGGLAAPAVAAAPTAMAPARITGITPAWTGHRTAAVQPAALTNATSINWSGYVATGVFGAVKGSWVVPTASCAGGVTTYSSFWAGLDGYTNGRVEQDGTDSDCVSGTPHYYAWTEMYPAPLNQLSTASYPVQPGDVITGQVLTNVGVVNMTISSSRGWSYTTYGSITGNVVSAEWIAEAPSDSFGPLPLTSFGTVSFSNCVTNTNTPIGSNPNVVEITMQLTKRMPSGEIGTLVEALPADLTGGGTAFTVTAFPYGHRYQI